MVQFSLVLDKFGEMGEKTGWTYILIPQALANQIKADTRVSFRVKGKIDSFELKQAALIPMGEGDFIFPVGTSVRRSIRKEAGDMVHITMELDTSEILISEDLLICLADDVRALERFEALAKSHQRYYSKWIEEAKTIETKSKRIAMAVEGLSKGMDYGAMMRYYKSLK
jgi:Domain of unknown function (DUF1905)/Bacteriocin-protection, YdeI or OmpD-Associated